MEHFDFDNFDNHEFSGFMKYVEDRLSDMIVTVFNKKMPFSIRSVEFEKDWDVCRVAFLLYGMEQEFVWYFSFNSYNAEVSREKR